MIVPTTHTPPNAEQEPERPAVEVLVTGFGPFRKYGVNPSYEIVSRLPNRIDPLDSEPGAPEIILRRPSDPVKVAYQHVFRAIPELYETYPNVRYFVHVGVSHLATCCQLETRARKGPYEGLDVDGRRWCGDADGWDDVWRSAPEQIQSAVDVEGIAVKMASGGKWEVSTSNDAGLYLCEFIYFNSMHTARRLGEAGRDIKGVFIHVPANLEPEILDSERDTVAQIIREMVAKG
ncbi:uncharacterized protein DNG_08182 [Cephalotrichum gorgonifer]|uniref:Peptidase_C15 domain-containing protein n=1 Tax=Cephalotrichum gorgonifer TaxID=2041049 RepID=A0AAE8N398_9PEZI|nr:uncharacterized protein DNG_08182 [Cephalotrichum gorgonifer]